MRGISWGTRPYLFKSLKINSCRGRPIYQIASCTYCLGPKAFWQTSIREHTPNSLQQYPVHYNAPTRGYEDVTATYICRVKIPLHIYAEHQYRHESEYESTVIIYIPVIIAQVHSYHRARYNITRYYITREYKSTIYNKIHIIKSWEVLTRSKRSLEQEKSCEERATVASTNSCLCCALWSATVRSTQSMLLDLDMKV